MDRLHIEQKIKNLFRLVPQQGASDLHLVVGRYPTLRIDGRLFSITQGEILKDEDTKAFASVLLSEREKKELAENGQVDFSYDFEGKMRFRVNTFYQQGYTSIVMRLIMKDIRTLEELHVPDMLYEVGKFSQGLVLITGPVGHGKSTTLAAIIDHINHNQDKNIITIEDPIEFIHQQDRCIISQREVGKDAESYPKALKAIFREDVNVVLLGELRDLDTISTVMTAAETGHLIFATLHTNDSSQTIDRIVDVFPAYQQNQIRSQLASVLVAVTSQRLVPRIDGGRIPALEIMFKNSAIENLIRENKAFQINNVIETNLNQGMISLDKSLATLAQQGLITIENAFAYARNKDYIKMLLRT
ncbi:MAG: PilT/PilU family type 4a pilus ATPase [Candidatus Moraniibacteriota bacterium]|nr:MAG: PilT/PilU family type 4a pilus ATPase [Candidatus Moranbacteria bacterium]